MHRTQNQQTIML